MNPSHAPPAATFALSPDEAMMFGLRRVANEQINLAVWHLNAQTDVDLNIHEARKALKRTRAVLRLLRDSIGDKTYSTANILCRDAGRYLSPLRISAVLDETVITLVDQSPALKDAAQPLLQALQRSHRARMQQISEHHDTLAEISERLQQVQELMSALPEFSDTMPVFRGLRRTYRRGYHELQMTLADPAAHHFHLWRKRVKYLRYQMQLLTFLWPPQMQLSHEQLVILSQKLGYQHDLVDLEVYLQQLSEPALQIAAARLQAPLLRQRRQLEQQALHLGRYVYAERPNAFRNRIRTYYENHTLADE